MICQPIEMKSMSTESRDKVGKIRKQNCEVILQAAEKTFVKNGFKGTSMQEIADAADLPKANVLYYFRSKKDLYATVLQGIAERWDSTLSSISEDDDPTEVLTYYIKTKVDLSMDYPDASRIFALEIIQGAPHLKEYLRNNIRQWLKDKCKIVDSWIAQGKMQAIDAEQLFFLIWSSTQHYADFQTQVLTVTNKQEYDAEDVEKIKDFLCSFILAGCGLQYQKVPRDLIAANS